MSVLSKKLEFEVPTLVSFDVPPEFRSFFRLCIYSMNKCILKVKFQISWRVLVNVPKGLLGNVSDAAFLYYLQKVFDYNFPGYRASFTYDVRTPQHILFELHNSIEG